MENKCYVLVETHVGGCAIHCFENVSNVKILLESIILSKMRQNVIKKVSDIDYKKDYNIHKITFRNNTQIIYIKKVPIITSDITDVKEFVIRNYKYSDEFSEINDQVSNLINSIKFE